MKLTMRRGSLECDVLVECIIGGLDAPLGVAAGVQRDGRPTEQSAGLLRRWRET